MGRKVGAEVRVVLLDVPAHAREGGTVDRGTIELHLGMHRWMGQCVGSWMDGWMDGLFDGSIDGWMDGLMGGQIDE